MTSELQTGRGGAKGNARGGSRRQARADEEWVDDEGIRDDDEEHDDEKTRRGGPQDRRGVFTKRSDPKRSLFPRRGDSTMRRRADKCGTLVRHASRSDRNKAKITSNVPTSYLLVISHFWVRCFLY